MTTEAKIGYGSVFAIQNTDSPPSYDAIAEVISISPPKLSRDTVDATHNQSTQGWREYIAGLKDGGEMSVDMNFIPGGASTTLLLATFNSDRVLPCKITFPDSPATEWTFNAICTGFEPDDPLDDKMTATATFKLTGKPTFVSA